MEILRQDTGTHFDPAVMALFERISQDIREKLQDSDEQSARTLLQGQIRRHFAT